MTAYFTKTLSGYRSSGEDYTEAQVADIIKDYPWAALNYDGDILAGTDKKRLAQLSGSPVTGAGLARLLTKPADESAT